MVKDSPVLPVALEQGSSPGRDAWHRLQKNRLAVAGGATLLVLTVLCVAGPWFLQATYQEQNLDLGATAPSGAHQQPWTFAVVSDPETKQRLREGAEAEEREFYDRRATPEWKGAVRPMGTDWMKTHITDAPYVIVVFEQAWRWENGEKVKHYYVRESVGIAVGFLLAAFQEAGLCALTHTPSPMRFLGEILGRPENERPFILIPVGYPADDAEVPDLERKPLDDIVVRI